MFDFASRLALETGAGRVIAAVDLRMAVLAGTADRPIAGCGTTTDELAGVVEVGLVIGVVVALLALERPCDGEQLVVIGTVRIVAVQAVVADRGVHPEERPAFVPTFSILTRPP